MFTPSLVKSVMEAILSLPLRAAFSMEAIRRSVVVSAGTSRMITCLSPSASILARTRICPRPSSYSETSIRPPVWKSGKTWKGRSSRMAISASSSSQKLCGRMCVAMPTAMPSVPIISSAGTFAGRHTGSLPRPS